jgi:hypothetical protein
MHAALGLNHHRWMVELFELHKSIIKTSQLKHQHEGRQAIAAR